MDNEVTATKRNRLFWLGRYAERTYNSVAVMMDFYDMMIDGPEPDYAGYCAKMGIPCIYTDINDFMQRHLYDPADLSSCMATMDAMLGNGMTLRETISTSTLAYLQMAQYSLVYSSEIDNPCVELQKVLDNIMAFRGSFDDTVISENARNIIKCGRMVERISTMARTGAPEDKLGAEIHKLINRMYKTDVDRDPIYTDIIVTSVDSSSGRRVPAAILIKAVENLFKI